MSPSWPLSQVEKSEVKKSKLLFPLKLVTDNAALSLSDEISDEIELEQLNNATELDDGALQYIAGYITFKVHIVYI